MASVDYRIDLAERNAHLLRVEARFAGGGDELDLKLPVWTPGSYLVREFERHVQDLSCTARGRAAAAGAQGRQGDLARRRRAAPARWSRATACTPTI